MDHNREFWNRQHNQDNVRTLSGCSFDATVDFLNVRKLIAPGMKVLEIGCGLGYVTKGFAKIADISVLDISDSALDRVRSVCESVYHINDVESLPSEYFDLIICHNVVQHVPTAPLRKELEHAIRSLKPRGTFALEYVWGDSIEDDGVDFDPAWATAGHLCRSDDFMTQLIQDLGGFCKISRTNPVPKHRKIKGLTVMHIRKFESTKVTVFGSKGMAGHMVVAYLQQQGHEVTALDRSHVDVENPQEVHAVLRGVNADFVVNCVGLLVKDSNDRPDRAALINAWFPHALEQYFKNTNTRVIHLSTDCVFDGAKGKYTEESLPTETNLYGRSKSLGEINNNKDITFRMSIIGPELKAGTGLLDWVRYNPNKTLQGWNNAWWNGITTLQLAKCIQIYIENPGISGVYHLVNNDVKITKYRLLKLINQTYNLNKVIESAKGPTPINKILVDTRNEVDWAIADYPTQLEELRNFNPLSHVSPATS
jgi:dTDP-4-dehydrorhamnose reductase